MTPATLAFACYWATPELRRDLDILIRAGHIQRCCAEAGTDTPAAWFQRAAKSYTGDEPVAALARRACMDVAWSLLEEAPQ